MGVAKPDFREGQVEKYDKNWNIVQSPQVLRSNFSSLSLKHTGIFPAIFVSQNALSSLKIEQIISKKYVLQQISIQSLNVAPLPHHNFGQSLKFYYAVLSGHNYNWTSQNFVLISLP